MVDGNSDSRIGGLNMKLDKKLYTAFFALAIPLVLQRLVNSVFSSIDVWMVSRITIDAMDGISIGGQWLWILNRILAGVSAGGLLFITQYSGMGKESAILTVFKKMLKIMTVSAVVFTVVAMLFPDFVIGLFAANESVMATAKEYLVISSLSFVLLAAANACTTLLIARGRGVAAMISVSANAVAHVVMNWIFIYVMKLPVGNGAAWAAVTSAGVGLLVAVPFVLKELKGFKCIGERAVINTKKLYKISLALIAHETIWGIGIFTYNAIFTHVDASGYSAVVVWRTINDFFFAVIAGFSAAGGIYMGNYVGEGIYQKAKEWAKKIQIIDTISSLVLGIILFAFAPLIVGFFNMDDAKVVGIAVLIVRIFATEIVLKSIAHTFVESIFRAGGNPEMGLILDTVATWVVVVPLCAVAAFVLKTGFLPVFIIMVFGEDIVKILISSVYFRTGKWYRCIDKK